jgi:predicted unusual protein kinase regulating ubiquinone biosynthesis (AarF/ABC1/UbiB family)
MQPMATKREIDLAAAPAGRVGRLLRLVARSMEIAFWLTIALARLPTLRLTRGSFEAAFGVAIAFLFERLGATFITIGQIMSSRPDLFPPRFLAPFIHLQDRVPPFSFDDVRRTIEEDFGRRLEDIFVAFDSRADLPAVWGRDFEPERAMATFHRAAKSEG